ncbi:hypothetical protein Hte_003558 [Hypoxylon texense]
MTVSKVPEAGNLWVGGVWALNLEGSRDKLYQQNVTHVLSVIKFSFDRWGEEAKRFKHMSIDVDDDPSCDLLIHFSSAVRFINNGLYPPSSGAEPDGGVETEEGKSQDVNTSPGGVFVHCAMGVSRSVSCVIAYLLYKYPHRFGGKQYTPSATSAAERRQTAKVAVEKALQLVRRGREIAFPNSGFMRQLELWWEMGCPTDDDSAVERHPVYQKWLYDRMLEENRSVHVAPEAEYIRFEDEVEQEKEGVEVETGKPDGKEVRCKKCRRILATPKFVVSHTPTGSEPSNCAHVFVDTLSWMRPALEGGALEGRLSCPNTKCGATVGRFAWQGLQCSCREWVVPAFSLNRSRIDEVAPRRTNAPAIRQPPGQNSSL